MIAFIPARSQSKSIPDKNIKLLGGKPLLVWSIEAALVCGLEPWVSSDSQEYLDIAQKHGAKTLLRPPHLAEDTSSTYEVLLHEIPRIEPQPMEIALFQPTSPFRKKRDVLGAIKKFHGIDTFYDSLIAAVPIPDKWHPDTALQFAPLPPWGGTLVQMASGVPVKDRKTRRQDHASSWVPSGGLYILKTKNLGLGNIYGDAVGMYEVGETININSLEDWNKAEEIAKTWTL